MREISQITNIPLGTLGDLKKRNTPLTKHRSGRPHKLSERHKRQIEFHIHRNFASRRLSVHTIIKNLQLESSKTTVKLALKDLGYYHRIARRRPFLKKIDRQRRLQFAKRHRHLTVDDWKSYIFCDEMSVKVGMERNTQDWVWRKVDEKFHPIHILLPQKR